MRIGTSGQGSTKPEPGKVSKSSGAKSSQDLGSPRVSQSGFTKFVEDATERLDRDALDRLKAEVDEAGRRLASQPTHDRMEAFKKLVQTFMKNVVDSSYKIRENAGHKGDARQKLFSLIERVDETLGLLADAVAKGDSVSVLSRLDEIRGMIVDLYT